MDKTLQYDLRIKYDANAVLEMIDCHKDNPNYDTYKKTLESLVEKK